MIHSWACSSCLSFQYLETKTNSHEFEASLHYNVQGSHEREEGDTDVTQFVVHLSDMYESPKSAPQWHARRPRWLMPVIPTVPAEGRISEVQGHPWLCIEFEASLGYLTH